jgi:hypothetical protein
VVPKQDVFGPTQEELPDDSLQRLELEVPRLGFRLQFLALLGNHVARSQKPT